MAKDFRRADDASRYELHLDGALVGVLDYREAPGSVSLVRSFTTLPFRGRGLAGELVSFAVDDIEAEHARLIGSGVVFTQPPTDIGAAVVAVFDDTCGNLIQLIEEKPDDNRDDPS